MSLEYADRVAETSTTTGTGTYDLAGAKAGFQSFVAGAGDGNTCYYTATDGTDWEVGLGTVTDAATDTLSRDSILASSNGGAAVNWSAGSKDIFLTTPASEIGDFAKLGGRSGGQTLQGGTDNGDSLTVVGPDATAVPLIVKGAVSQTGDYFQIVDSADAEILTISESSGDTIIGRGAGQITIQTVGSNGDVVIDILGKGTVVFDGSTRNIDPTSGSWGLGTSSNPFATLHLSSYLFMAVLTDATRGAAGNQGRMIFNSDDGQLNIDDGSNWTLPEGTIT